MNIIATISVSPTVNPCRLDEFLAKQSPLFPSRKAAYKAIKRGEITVNNDRCPPHQTVESGDHIAIFEDDRVTPPPLELALTIVYEDAHLAVLIKPAGIPVSGNFARTIQRALPTNLTPSSMADTLRLPRPAHRLDGPTGGLLLVGKTARALTDLNRQFQERRLFKRYCAVAAGPLQPLCTVNASVDGRPAQTTFRVVQSVPSLNYGRLCLVECVPLTGRKHQIRRHLAHLAAPVVGDRTYGTAGKVLKGKGLFLYAVELAFEHPETGDSMNILVPPPSKFAALMEREQRRTERLAQNERWL